MGDLNDPTSLLGFIETKVVGLHHHSSTIRAGETLALVQEPSDMHGEMAIQVLNTGGIRVGYIERTAAAVLAPLMDSQLISMEGIVRYVPSVRRLCFLNLQVRIFAREEDFEHVMLAISEGKLILKVRSVDENFTLVGQKLGKKAKMEPLEPPMEFIKTVLFEHQKQGLGWLVHRENSEELPPFWEEKGGKYINVLTNYCSDKRPEPLRGGIFADEMGSGKTLTMFSLIALDKSDGSVVAVKSESAKRKGKGKMGISQPLKKRKNGPNSTSSVTLLDDDEEAWEGTKSTLVVCPPSALSTWITQLREHTSRMTLYSYHSRRTNDAEELRRHDIVLTTYAILAREQRLRESPLKKIQWWRVILDEAHVIRNVNTQQSRAVTSLNARRRWAVTGIPLQNNSLDLFSLMVFLRFVPFSIKRYWQSLIQCPLSQLNQQIGLYRLQVLMASLSLRRTKDEVLIGLPQKTIKTHYVKLSSEELELYDHTCKYTSLHRIILRLRLRQICSSMALCPLEVISPLPDVSNNPELLKKLDAELQDSEKNKCPICIYPCRSIIITRCAHFYCRACILKTLRISQRQCSFCRGPLAESDLFSPPPESSKSSEVENCSSAKVSALLKLLLEAKDRNLSSKSVVFSQFRRILLLLEGPLKEAGFKILRVDGSMSANRRQKVIKEFGAEQNTPIVLLASLKASAAGIDLTAASTVYLLEPWWNPAVEEQAMDRVHRIGQNEDVKIVRLIANDTIEDKILELQKTKKELARKAFGMLGSTDSSS